MLDRIKFGPDAGEASGGGGGATIPDEGSQGGAAAAGGQDGGGAAGAEGGAGSGQAQTWADQALPAEMAPIYEGCKTLGDLHKRYQESSREGREQRAHLTKLQERYVEQLSQFGNGQRQQPQPQQPAQQGYNGFASKEEFIAAYKLDPQSAFDRAIDARAQTMMEKYAKQHLQPQIEQSQQAAQQARDVQWQQHVADTWNGFQQRYPDFAVGKPMHQALVKAFETNKALQEFAFKDYPQALEFAAAKIDRDIKAQQHKASTQKLDETRGRSATARVGAGGGAGAPKNGTFEARIRQSAEKARLAGETVTEDQVLERIQQGRALGLK